MRVVPFIKSRVVFRQELAAPLVLVEDQPFFGHAELARKIPRVGAVSGKVVKAAEAEMVLVGWVMIGVGMGVMRRPNFNPPSRLADAVQLFHGTHGILQVLNHVAEDNPVIPVGGDRPGEFFKIVDDFNARVGADINAAISSGIARIAATHI